MVLTLEEAIEKAKNKLKNKKVSNRNYEEVFISYLIRDYKLVYNIKDLDMEDILSLLYNISQEYDDIRSHVQINKLSVLSFISQWAKKENLEFDPMIPRKAKFKFFTIVKKDFTK